MLVGPRKTLERALGTPDERSIFTTAAAIHSASYCERSPMRSRITITSMHIPPMAATHQMIPPAPEGEKNVASDMFVAIIVQNSVTVATNRRRIIPNVNVTRNITNITAPTIPVSPRIISGNTPFSIGADHNEISPSSYAVLWYSIT